MAATTPYRHRSWRRIRAEILARDGQRCQIKGPLCTGAATAVDHITPWRDGGSWFDPSNLRAACGPCNGSRAAKQKNQHGWVRSETVIVLVLGSRDDPPDVPDDVGPNDVVIDFDRLADAVGPPLPRGAERTPATVEAAKVARSALIFQAQRGELGSANRIFILSADPSAANRFPHHELRSNASNPRW